MAHSRAQARDASGRWEKLITLEKASLDDYDVQIPVYQSYQVILENPQVSDINRPGQSYINYRWADIQTVD
ncbi:hypothetical protein ACRCJW_00300 [Aerococcus urinaeequi]|uniref:hypothetical protein n=1 Tax=Aerococcus urinaeequi TaxID=51665 RepID=UPI003D6AD334